MTENNELKNKCLPKYGDSLLGKNESLNNELNERLSILEGKENLIKKENLEIEIKRKELQNDIRENERIRQENELLINKNKQLEKEINEKQIQIQGLSSNNKNGIKKSVLNNWIYRS